MIEQLENEKRCTGPCAAMLPLSCYYRQSATKDGRQSICKECKKLAKRRDGASSKEWRPAEELELMDHVANGGDLRSFAQRSGRTLSSVKNKAGVLASMTRGEVDEIGRTPFQPTAELHRAWQQIDRRIAAIPAANGPSFSLGAIAA